MVLAFGRAKGRLVRCEPSFQCTIRRFNSWFCKSGIRSIAEMAGKRVGVGPRGGTSAAYFPQFFQTLKTPVNLVFGDWAELAAQVHQRTLDVLAVGAGVP